MNLEFKKLYFPFVFFFFLCNYINLKNKQQKYQLLEGILRNEIDKMMKFKKQESNHQSDAAELHFRGRERC